jgi:hypothetical protein
MLQRFRRIVAPPGRPGEAVGVPASGAELEGELGPVLERLDGVDAEATEVEARASAEARRRSDGADREAAAILAEARLDADAERVRATDDVLAEAERKVRATRSDATSEVERIEAMRAERVALLVDEVVACVKRSER